MQANLQSIPNVPELNPLRMTMTTDQEKTLGLLKAANQVGMTGPELLEHVWNYKGRIHELRHKFGAKIKSVSIPRKRFKRYILQGMKTIQEIREENKMVWISSGRFEMLVPAYEVKS